MKRIPWLLAGLLLMLGCGKDPTSSRLDQLQQEVDQLKTDNAAQRQDLLARLDQLAVSQDDSAEVGDIRAKLAQADVTAPDLQRLQARVSALIATFKDGTISALRPPETGHPYAVGDSYIVQHNLDLSGSTSGSPIFDMAGKTVAINNAGISEVVQTTSGGSARVSQAALGFGIRADKIHELLDRSPAAKPVAGGMGEVPWLEGRALDELGIVPCDARYDLGRRLEARLGLGR